MPMLQLGLLLLFAVIQPSVIAVSVQPQSNYSTVYECICANTTKDMESFNGLAHCDNGDKVVYVGILTLLQAAPLAADLQSISTVTHFLITSL